MATTARVGFLGAGRMASALAQGFVRGGGVVSSTQITASCPPADAALLADFSQFGARTTHDNIKVAAESDILMLAVKPNIVPR